MANKCKLLEDAKGGKMSLKYISQQPISNTYGLKNWRKVTKSNASGLWMGQCKLTLPCTELIDYDGSRLRIYDTENGEKVLQRQYAVYVKNK